MNDVVVILEALRSFDDKVVGESWSMPDCERSRALVDGGYVKVLAMVEFTTMGEPGGSTGTEPGNGQDHEPVDGGGTQPQGGP